MLVSNVVNKTFCKLLAYTVFTTLCFAVTNSSILLAQSSVIKGKQLAQRYCQSCHLLPEPNLLDKKTWVENVLPNMGLRLGIKEAGKNPYQDLAVEDSLLIRQMGVYPETPMLSVEEWKQIVAYYENQAPDIPLPQSVHLAIYSDLPFFTTKHIQLSDKPIPQTTLLKFDTTEAKLYVGDANNLYVLNNKWQIQNIWDIGSPSADIDFPKDAPPRLLTIGIFKPSDQKLGRLLSLDTVLTTVNLGNLPRPVQFATTDLNDDKKEDVIICGFGNHSGKLFWYDNFEPSKEHILKALPGARRVEITDLNHDNKPDIVALMAQAYEEVTIFYNEGQGKFREKTVLRFPPVYGVSYIELADFNHDGFKDILLTTGDNWDYSAIPKNYHGVGVYINDGKDNFKQHFFYPLYGTSKAITRDFDQDGDLDIAATAFYNDLENPAHSFVYLENQGQLQFKALSTPEAAHGKWLTMEAADFDHDGDIDIALGSYFHTVGELTKLIYKGIVSFPQILILTNSKIK